MGNNKINEAILNSYLSLIDFLSSIYGRDCAAVLYRVDAATGSGRIIAVRNDPPFLAAIGDEMGLVGKRILAGSKEKGYRYLVNINYTEGVDSDQYKICYFLIQNPDNKEVIGMILVSFKIGYLMQSKSFLDQFLGFEATNENRREQNDFYYELENGDFSINKYAQGIISNVIAENNIPVERMTMDEKADIVRKLERMEVFNIKGAVREAAEQLMVSVATIYRLMKRQTES